MLQHEPEGQADATPAAQRRVTADELAQAVNALEANKDEAARHLAGTVPIGEVVEELKLAATPEELWAQVQRQRAQAAQASARVTPPAAPVVPAIRAKAVGRRMVRGWRDAKSWLWILFWCTGGMGLLSAIPHWEHPAPPPPESMSAATTACPPTPSTMRTPRSAATITRSCCAARSEALK